MGLEKFWIRATNICFQDPFLLDFILKKLKSVQIVQNLQHMLYLNHGELAVSY